MAEARIVRSSEGDVYECQWRFKHGSLTGGRFDFMIGNIDYLTGPPFHVHDEQDDTFYVIEGVLAVQVGNDMYDLGPGDFATVPPGVPHTFDNIRKDQSPVQLCNLMTPGGLDRQFRDMSLMDDTADDPEGVARIREKYGITVVGPTLGARLGLA